MQLTQGEEPWPGTERDRNECNGYSIPDAAKRPPGGCEGPSRLMVRRKPEQGSGAARRVLPAKEV
jgi:hypothetical protein